MLLPCAPTPLMSAPMTSPLTLWWQRPPKKHLAQRQVAVVWTMSRILNGKLLEYCYSNLTVVSVFLVLIRKFMTLWAVKMIQWIFFLTIKNYQQRLRFLFRVGSQNRNLFHTTLKQGKFHSIVKYDRELVLRFSSLIAMRQFQQTISKINVL